MASSPSETGGSTEALAAGLRSRVHGLVVCLSRSWGGLEQVAAQDALDAGAAGLNMRVLVLEGSPIHQNLAHRPEVRVFPLDFRPRNYFDLKLRAVLKALLDEGVNLIHTHQTSVLGSIVPWLWGHPKVAMIATRHIMNNHDKRGFFHQAIYSRVDSLIVMSQTLKRNVLDTHPVREPKVKVVNLGLDFVRFDPARVDSRRQRAEWGADDDTCVIGLVGRIDPAKGQDVFIKAAAGLLMGDGEKLDPSRKLRFVIVGAETIGSGLNYLAELKTMVTQFRLDDHVVFAGFKENIPEVMGAFDIFVMPSHQEAFGLVAIEAMAMECPVIISSGGSAEEIVGAQEFGLTVRPNDAFDLQRQLRVMLEKPELRAEMGKRARAHVMRHYDRSARLRETLELYERAMRRRGWAAG